MENITLNYNTNKQLCYNQEGMDFIFTYFL